MKPKRINRKKLITAAIAILVLLLLSPLYINPKHPGWLCVSCHEMRGPFLSWRTSTHSKQICTDCHNAPGAFRMLFSHIFTPFKSWEDVSSQSFKTCVKCHEKIPGTVYFHSIKFPHDSHRKYLEDCRVCHENVVHGSRNEYRNAPKKETCYKCHDNKTASQNCKLCHLTFTKGLPQQLDPKWIESHKTDVTKFKTSCVKCHDQKFCNDCHHLVNPHPGGWLKKEHQSVAKATTKKCQICHSSADCTDCHEVLVEHRTDWYDGHRRLALQSQKSCVKCHDKEFCISCHKGITTHKQGWLQQHRTDPNAKTRVTCAKCHTDKYCASCHGGKPTLHHVGNWLSNHGASLSAQNANKADIENCISCHVPEFCLSCHRGVRKNVHSRDFMPMHKSVSPQSMVQCKMCHTLDSCNKCHKSNLPVDHKDAQWKQSHGMGAIKNMDSCTLCHEKAFCEACHNRKVPASHEAKAWGKTHGIGSRDKDAACSLCHDNRFCNTCHRRTKPPDHYGDNWTQTHGRTAMTDMNSCSVCHDTKDCKRCHGDKKVHNVPGWMKNHDVSRNNRTFGQCSQCHGLGTCVDCHESSGVGGHGNCTGCHASMSNPRKLKPNPCASCHHDKMPTTDIHKKHEAQGCLNCHKEHGWKAEVTACAACHKKDNDHTSGMPCTDCHSFK